MSPLHKIHQIFNTDYDRILITGWKLKKTIGIGAEICSIHFIAHISKIITKVKNPKSNLRLKIISYHTTYTENYGSFIIILIMVFRVPKTEWLAALHDSNKR